VTCRRSRLLSLKPTMPAHQVASSQESDVKSTSTEVFSLASSMIRRPSFAEFEINEPTIGRSLTHIESMNERLGAISRPHANEPSIDQPRLLQTISRRYSHPDIQHFLQPKSDFE
jgi:hypothetical protein